MITIKKGSETMKKPRVSPVLLAAMGVNFILFSVKLYIGLRTNSLCIYTDAMNNLADTASAGVGVLGLFFVSGRATRRFPYGFGRMEYLTEFLMALLMTAAGASFAYQSLERFFAPVPVWFSTKYAGIIAATCLVKLAMGIIFRSFRRRREDSGIVRTLELDSFLDFGVTLAAVASFSLTNYIGFAIDSVLGLAISLTIVAEGIRLILSSSGRLIGQAQPQREAQISADVASCAPGVRILSLRIHSYGRGHDFAELTLAGDKTGNISDMEHIRMNIKKLLAESYAIGATVEWEENYGERKEKDGQGPESR